MGKSEYLTLRMAFITVLFIFFLLLVTGPSFFNLKILFQNHNAKLDFDFHSYLMKTMEIDISYVIGTKCVFLSFIFLFVFLFGFFFFLILRNYSSFSLWIWVVIVFALNVNGNFPHFSLF